MLNIVKKNKIIASKEETNNSILLPNNYEVFQKFLNKSKFNPKILIKPNTTKKEFSKLHFTQGKIMEMAKGQEMLKSSSYKLNKIAIKLRNKYLQDAEQVISEDVSKSALYVKKQIAAFKEKNKELIRNGNYQLFINQATVGGCKGRRRVFFRAKGRVDIQQGRKSAIRIQFIKVSKQKFCEDLIQGKVPNFVNYIIRKELYKRNGSLNEINSLSFLTNRRDAHKRRVVIDQMVSRLVKSYAKEKKTVINKNIIRKKIITEMAKKFIPIYQKYLVNVYVPENIDTQVAVIKDNFDIAVDEEISKRYQTMVENAENFKEDKILNF